MTPVSGLRRALVFASATALLACAQQAVDDASPSPDSGPRPARVVLISVAGLTPAHYGVDGDVGAEGANGLQAQAAVMRNLAELARGGAYAEAVRPVVPSSSYPVHASLATGLEPVRHAVLGDELMGPEGLHLRGIARESRIRGVPIWRAARAAGHKVTSLAWPSTRGADIELLLPDMGVPAPDKKANWLEALSHEATPWVVDRLGRMDENIANVPWPTGVLQDALVERLACEIAGQPVTPSLWLIAFEQTGVALGRDGPDDDQSRAALGRVDASIGRIVACFRENGLAEDTAFLVVGDRSFLPIHTLASPNVALERVGLITLAPVLRGSGIARWRAIVRSSGGAGLVYADSEQDALLARSALEEQANRTRAFRIVAATELQQLDADPQAWFGVEGLAGYGIAKAFTGQLTQATQRKGLGGYLPSHARSAVGFVAWGAGVRSGTHVSSLSQVDVGPTAAHLLGFELPSADGAPVAGILGR